MPIRHCSIRTYATLWALSLRLASARNSMMQQPNALLGQADCDFCQRLLGMASLVSGLPLFCRLRPFYP
eukprot:COSAG02_NODE_47019_length_344_cov_0.828571_1_plen_68_part_10